MSTPMEAELTRIRIVSERFGQLMGLRVAFLGMVWVIVFGTYFLAGPPQGHAIWVALGLSFVVLIPGEIFLGHYYASTFGRWVPKKRRSWLVVGFAYGLSGPLWQHYGASPLPVLLLVPAWLSLVAGVRDWPVRSYHLAGVAASVIGTLLPMTSAGATAPNTASAAGLLLFGATYVPIGFLDHRLLVASMRPDGSRTGPRL